MSTVLSGHGRKNRSNVFSFLVTRVTRFCFGQVELVVNALRDSTVKLCLDTNGNHVVQRLLQHLAPADNAFVFEVTVFLYFVFVFVFFQLYFFI